MMIKFLIMDVDGTLTDGKIYMGDCGEMMKAFDVKDGYGIKEMLPMVDIIPIIITARSSKILATRCKELNIEHCYQGIKNKLEKVDELLSEFSKAEKVKLGYEVCAYIGDDILDLQCMYPIKEAGGFIGCPHDATEKVKAVADFVSEKNGGAGVVREFIEWLLKNDICPKCT